MNSNNLLYKQVETFILDNIRNNIWKPGEQIPSEKELTERFGVSRITTKKAMENLVRDGVIYRKKGHGSFVSKSAIQMRIDRQRIISMIIPYGSSRTELLGYINGASEYLSTKNYYLSIHCTEGESFKKEREFLLKLPKENISGIIYYPLNIYKEFDIMVPMCLDKYPLVTIDKYMLSPSLCSVVSDNLKGTYDVVAELIKAGHRNIAFISRNEIDGASSLKERYIGYCMALKENGGIIDEENVFTNYSVQTFECETYQKVQIMEKKLEYYLDKGVTSFFIENDPVIIKALRALAGRRKDIAERVCVAGFDDIIVPEDLGVRVIAAKQNYYEIGYRAAEYVYKIIEEGAYEGSVVKVPVKIEIN